jgi:RNA polymerase sigma-70 factor (ECF subfamily)
MTSINDISRSRVDDRSGIGKRTIESQSVSEITEIYERHCKTVYRVCFAYMKNQADTEDAVQETFYKLIKVGTPFESKEHEKAWLIRTASNLCKNTLKHWWRKRENLDDYHYLHAKESFIIDDVFELVLALPEKHKTVVYLYYYEGYDSVEIARILGKPQPTIRYRLYEARKILKAKLGADFFEE